MDVDASLLNSDGAQNSEYVSNSCRSDVTSLTGRSCDDVNPYDSPALMDLEGRLVRTSVFQTTVAGAWVIRPIGDVCYDSGGNEPLNSIEPTYTEMRRFWELLLMCLGSLQSGARSMNACCPLEFRE